MQKIWSWFKDNAAAIGTLAGILVVLGGGAKFAVIDPIHQRFDAIDQRFDDQNQYINQRLDDQNKQINQRFDAIDQRFDAVDQRFNDQNRYIDQRFDAVDQRFDTVEKRLDRLETGMAELRKLGGRVSRNEERIGTLEEKLQAADIP